MAVGVLTVSLWINLGRVHSTEFHRDEARWVHRAYYLRELLDPFGPTWDDKLLSRGQPPLGSYLMGVGLVLQGRDLDTNGLWSFFHDPEWNERRGRMPEPADLRAARRTNAVVGAFSVLLVFLIARRLSNPVGGVAAALVAAFHPTHVYLSSLAGSDALLGLCVVGAAWAAIRLADRPSWGRALVLGVALGLGTATKLSPILVALALAGVGAVLVLGGIVPRSVADRRPVRWATGPRMPAAPWRFRLRRELGWMLLSVPVVAGIVFVVSYPYLWTDPIGHTVNLFSFRAEEMESQGEIWSELGVESRREAVERVGIWLGERRSTARWFGDQIRVRIGVALVPPSVDLILAMPGAILLVGAAVRRGPRSAQALVAVALGCQVATIVAAMRADFERYQQPILLAVAVCAGVFVGQGWVAARALEARWKMRARPARTTAVADPTPVTVPAPVVARQ